METGEKNEFTENKFTLIVPNDCSAFPEYVFDDIHLSPLQSFQEEEIS